MYTNQDTNIPQYFQYIKKYQQLCPSNNYQMYNYYNQQPASTPEKKVSSIWMGHVEPYMTESFITGAFQKMGEYPKNVKLIRNKDTGETTGYAYVDFYDPVSVMQKLNGKYIPGTNPPVQFKLNHAGSPGKNNSSDRDFSVWIGELSPDVDDYKLHKTFACRYQSIRSAKMVLDSAGFSKGHGFISFGSEEEQKHCLNNMNGFAGLGSKLIKVMSVIPKSKPHDASNSSQGYKASQDYEQYFETDYWHQYSIWNHPQSHKCMLEPTIETPVVETIDNVTVVDYKKSIEVDALNKGLISQDYNLWDALESSKWPPFNTIEDV